MQAPARVVVGVLSPNDGDPEAVYTAIKSSSRRASLIRVDGTAEGRSPRPELSSLRLKGESLLVAEISQKKLSLAVQVLRNSGAIAVFVLLQDAPGDLGKASQADPSSILSRLQNSRTLLEGAYDDLTEAVSFHQALTQAGQWLIDNIYMVRTQVAEIRQDLPREYRRHPKGGSPGSRAFQLARKLVAQTEHSLSEANISECLREYQVQTPLTIAELWSFPLLVRVALIEELAKLAWRASLAQRFRQEAFLWANRLAASIRSEENAFGRILSQLESEPFAGERGFVIALAEQLQDQESALAPVQRWIEERLQVPIPELVRAEHTSEASEAVMTANAFGSLRVLSHLDFTKIFEAVSLTEIVLRQDPGGIYERSDFATRSQCRQVVEQIARHSGVEEPVVARRAIVLAGESENPRHRHVMHYLLTPAVWKLEKNLGARTPASLRLLRGLRRRATAVYLGSITGLTACFTVLAIDLARDAGVGGRGLLVLLATLALFPLSELAIQIVHALVISLFPPETLPKMDFREQIPAESATLVIVPMMLSTPAGVRREVEELEIRYLANPETNLFYGLISDFLDAPDITAPGDAELLRTARTGIEELNTKYPGGRFLLFHRGRSWSESEQKWIGKERKRGKLGELNAFLCGQGKPELLQTGKLSLPIRYVITLDADTELPPTAGRRMVETISHPLNRVEMDPTTKVRKYGFTVIQPRVSIALPGATATRFTRIFADAAGSDPYCNAVSDAQQDLLGEAIFHGKAIYDVEAFHTILGDRFPPETLLSHDLIEGAHAGVGLASDIELLESIPLNYPSFAKRQHRWIRGDWQIGAWFLKNVPAASGGFEPNPLSLINRWRILDNLRRSLVPIASLLLLLFAWLVSAAPGIWSIVVALAVAIPAFAPLLDRWVRHVQGSVYGWQGAADELLHTVVMTAFLPHQAWLSADAIARACYREWISKRNLLEWRTAEAAEVDHGVHRESTVRQMMAISGASILLLVLEGAKGAFAPTSFLILWIFSPVLMRWLGRRPTSQRQQISSRDALFLRHTARRTWRFFDDLVTAESNWLPPDNSQMALRVEVAQRTSPTNIGLWFGSALAALDFGYLTTEGFVRRCTRTMDTLERLERYEGHLLNWYDIRTLEPLQPRYVSTVDSGNLIANLWTLERGCEDALRTSLLDSTTLRGLRDTFAILREMCGKDPSLSVPLHGLRTLLRDRTGQHDVIGMLRLASHHAGQLSEMPRWKTSPSDERTYWAARLAQELNSCTQVVDRYLRWMETLTHPPDEFLRALGEEAIHHRQRILKTVPSLATLTSDKPGPMEAILAWQGMPELRPEASAWLAQLSKEYREAQGNARELVAALQSLCVRAGSLAGGMNMRFLYDQQRRLFGVGYSVGGPVTFSSHYDLLASECRLGSLIAIAKGDVPIEHWFALSRPRVSAPGTKALLSWSGTMFEYLMPLLYARTFENSLLYQACNEAVACQMEYGRERQVPWGVSECAYSALDVNQIYQYRAFGVPALALKPSLEGDLVVAPYATMLALMVDAQDALENLRSLKEYGLHGPMGFYESIDFTRERKREGQRGVVIFTYMAHHQGMTLLSLDNLLNNGALQRRFHSDRRIRAVESLLFERVPIARLHMDEVRTTMTPVSEMTSEEPPDRTWKEEASLPRVHLNSNGRYALMITSAGGGYSRWQDLDVTRWRSDATLDAWGSFIYIRDVRSGAVWSPTHQPLGREAGEILTTFAADRVEFRRRANGIETVLDVTVATEDDAELRRLIVTNRSLRARRLEFTGYAELALAPHAADRAHPAFAKMFVETESLDEFVLLAHRRHRSPDDPRIWAAYVLVGASEGVQHETDRCQYLGRGNPVKNPEALARGLAGTTGTVLDPVFSLRCRVTLDPRQRVELSFVTLTAATREELMVLVAKYRRAESVGRAFEMAWTRAQLEFRFLGIGPAAAHRFQELAGHLLYPNPALRARGERLTSNGLGQEALWALGISGDLPMVVVTVAEAQGIPLVRELLLAHAYWRMRGFRADLIILNQEGSSYDRPLYQELVQLIEAHAGESGIDIPGGTFLRDWNAIPEVQRTLLLAVAAVVLSGSRGSLEQQLSGGREPAISVPFMPSQGGSEEPSQPLPFLELPYFNGLGGFTQDGREYAIYLKFGSQTPMPWVNVMANPRFGTLVSESGLGFTWWGNSQTNRLTPWHNDPVTDPQSEVIYLRDDESGAVWSPTPSPVRERDAYRARHGQGYTIFEHNSHAIGQELTVFVPVDDPVKIYRLRLRNDSSRKRHFTVTYFAEWVLGSTREEQQLHVRTWHDDESGAVVAKQTWRPDFANRVAFAAASPAASSYSGNRATFLGRNGSVSKPAALECMQLDKDCRLGNDPCAGLQLQVTLEQGGHAEVVFFLGQTDTLESMRSLIRRYGNAASVENALAAVQGSWNSKLDVLRVKTPVLSVDFLLNRWLLYQVLSCRFWARSALYQSSGAFGFRDQLQDSMALLYCAPALTRAHILVAAARQFPEGDVQHWWHAESGNGVRTRCSDDLLWLPYVTAQYIQVTGDAGILQEEAPFLEGPLLAHDEHEKMFAPAISARTDTLWGHCRRAIDHAGQLGPHGLPLIGNGDWNDGLNRVGIEGRGESVWLGWFLCDILKKFASLADSRDPLLAAQWRNRAGGLAASLEHSAWDGEWYLRGFFDNGSPLGSHANTEAQIDSLPQSWAVISASADPGRAALSMDSAERLLVDTRNQLVRLFTPPFDHSEPHPGYIMGYPPGVRENGGQYTHGSLWVALARAMMGNGKAAVGLLQMMNPVEHSRAPADVNKYRGEPYVAPADVLEAPGHAGVCGWTWYTGSAAWMYRIWVEEVLGFRLRENMLTLEPAIPEEWPGFEIRYRHHSSTYEISVRRRPTAGGALMEVDGRLLENNTVLLIDDGGTHQIAVWLALAPSSQEETVTAPVAGRSHVVRSPQ